jgi:hypothetical protein
LASQFHAECRDKHVSDRILLASSSQKDVLGIEKQALRPIDQAAFAPGKLLLILQKQHSGIVDHIHPASEVL